MNRKKKGLYIACRSTFAALELAIARFVNGIFPASSNGERRRLASNRGLDESSSSLKLGIIVGQITPHLHVWRLAHSAELR
jgi:hypothetical protein